MREIKFRAWDKPNKRFTEYFYVSAFGGVFSDCDPRGIDMSGKRRIILAPDRYEVMQFTGLLDKNGKEIYKDDVISWPGEDDNCKVIWHERFASFALRKRGWAFIHFFGEAVDSSDCEVIGNIYENPELLK